MLGGALDIAILRKSFLGITNVTFGITSPLGSVGIGIDTFGKTDFFWKTRSGGSGSVNITPGKEPSIEGAKPPLEEASPSPSANEPGGLGHLQEQEQSGGGDYLLFDGTRVPGKERIDGTLYWYSGSGNVRASWPALSGSRNKLPIPNGEDWVVRGFEYRDKRNLTRLHEAMIRDGVGFSIGIYPDRYGRSLLKIHPDGNKIGTLGCIGLTCGSSGLSQFESMIINHLSIHGSINLKVRGSYFGSDRGWPLINK